MLETESEEERQKRRDEAGNVCHTSSGGGTWVAHGRLTPREGAGEAGGWVGVGVGGWGSRNLGIGC